MDNKAKKQDIAILNLKSEIEPFLRQFKNVDEDIINNKCIKNFCKYELECDFDFVDWAASKISIGYILKRKVTMDGDEFVDDVLTGDEFSTEFWNSEYGWIREDYRKTSQNPTVLKDFENFPIDERNNTSIFLTPQYTRPKTNKYIFTTSRDFEVFEFLKTNPPVACIKQYIDKTQTFLPTLAEYKDEEVVDGWVLAYTYTKIKYFDSSTKEFICKVKRENHQFSPLLNSFVKPYAKQPLTEGLEDKMHLSTENLKGIMNNIKISNNPHLVEPELVKPSFWQYIKTFLGF